MHGRTLELDSGPTAQPQSRGRLRSLLDRLANWRRSRRQRLQLAQVGDRQLRDIGLTPDDIEREIMRPFWQW
jgi:uncharacterized protein YjiS (DUF1127 family)